MSMNVELLRSLEDDPEAMKLYRQLTELWGRLQTTLDAKWNRTVTFGDYFVDRWERARRLGFGEGTSMYDSSVVFGDVTVGEKTWIGPFTVLDGSGGLEIGSTCSLSAGVQVYTHHTVEWALSGGELPPEHAPVRIGSRCYFGPNTIVSKGVTIGDGCVIGACSLVTSDIPAGSKAVGVPCRIVGQAEPPAR